LINIIQIIPRLPPAIDGVGDYALHLARQLRKDYNIQTHFIVGNPGWRGAPEIEGFPISQVSDRSAETLLSILLGNQPCAILLHYVGYGYAQRGCPVWLIKGLQRWKTLFSSQTLITMFHEIYASSYPVWTSPFWLSPLQKSLAISLARLSKYCWTSQQKNAQILQQITAAKHGLTFSMPVFSNIGEAQNLPILHKRKQRLVIFGTYGRRLPIYQKSHHILSKIVQDLAIQEILDIGKPLSLTLTKIADVPIVELGERSASDISSLLLDAVAGVIDYPANLLAKSGIFAAYCAHGLLPIIVGTESVSKEIDGLIPGKHYWLPEWESQSLQMAIAQDIASNAYVWYQGHNLAVNAQTIFNYLYNNSYI
jgi:hypothetical protein